MFDNTLYIPFSAECPLSDTVYMLGVSGNGYTNSLCTFTFYLDDNTPLPFWMSNDKIIWDFGDGTTSKAITAQHVYDYPGVYTVSLVMYSSAGESYLSTQTRQISVINFIDDRLDLLSGGPFNIPARQIGPLGETDINIVRYNSYQSWNNLSADNYTINLYASGSGSRKLDVDNYNNNKWAHIDQTWSFYTQKINNNGTIDNIPIDSIKTVQNEELYYKIDTDTQTIVRSVSTDSDAVMLGTSGRCHFFYADDTPKNMTSSEPPVFLFMSIDTSKFPTRYDSQSNTLIDISRYQNKKLVVPVKIRFSPADSIKITTNGISTTSNSFALTGFKYVNTENACFFQLKTKTGTITENYPPLTANTVPYKETDSTNIVNIGIFDTNRNSISALYFQDTSNNIKDINSAWRGYFIPRETSSNAILSATCTVYNPLYFPHDITHTLISSLSNQSLMISPMVTRYNSDGTKTILDTVERIPFENSHDIYGLAVVPISGTKITDYRHQIFACDGAGERVYRIDSNYNILSSIALSAADSIIPPNTALATISLIDGAAAGGNPRKAVSDKDRNVWITLHNGLSTFKIDYKSGNITRLLVASGAYLDDTLAWSLDVDSDINVWVTYGSALCCFCDKYNSSGTQLLTYVLPNSACPKDIVIDSSNDVWIITNREKYGRVARESLASDGVSAVRVSITSAGRTGDFFRYTFINQTSSIQPNDIVKITNLDYDYYNGTFIVEEVESVSNIIIRPHPVSLNLTTFYTLVDAGSASIQVYNSDTVYKLRKDGTEITTVTGFYSPNYITCDKNQNVWVAHNWDSLTQITSAGTLSSTYYPSNTASLINATDTTTITAISPYLSGIAADLGNNIWVINSIEQKLYFVDINTGELKTSTLDTGNVSSLNAYQAFGDWNGQGWYNKNIDFNTKNTIQSETSFEILPVSGKYAVYKINEERDLSEMYSELRFQDFLTDYTNMFDNFVKQIVGEASSNPNVLGKRVYEKIANYVQNISDPDTCDIDALYSLHDEVNEDIDNYRFLFPSNLKRIINLVSINQKKLWGSRSKYNRDFNPRGSTSSDYAKNIGTELNVLTDIISAGQKIVAEQLFNKEFKLIEASYVSAGSVHENHPDYITVGTTKVGLSSYPLSSYDISWQWNLDKEITGPDIRKYYNFYEFVDTYANTQLEGIIDWDNEFTTLLESQSSINEWTRDFGIVDSLIDFELRDGFNLFDTTINPTPSSLQYNYRPYWNKIDNINAVSGAFGFEKLLTTYSGNALCARRYSDNTFLGIGFDSNGMFDIDSLSTFTADTSAFVYAWFDQSNNNNTLIQKVTANQPILARDGIVSQNSKGDPIMEFTGNQFLSASFGTNMLYFKPTSNDISYLATKIEFSDTSNNKQVIYSESVNNQDNIIAGLSSNKLYLQYYITNVNGDDIALNHLTYSDSKINSISSFTIDTSYHFDHIQGGIIYLSGANIGDNLNLTTSLAASPDNRSIQLTKTTIGKSPSGNYLYGKLNELIMINNRLVQGEIEILNE